MRRLIGFSAVAHAGYMALAFVCRVEEARMLMDFTLRRVLRRGRA